MPLSQLEVTVATPETHSSWSGHPSWCHPLYPGSRSFVCRGSAGLSSASFMFWAGRGQRPGSEHSSPPQASFGSWAMHCVILVPSSSPCSSWAQPLPMGDKLGPSNADHSALLPRGTAAFRTVVLKQSGVNKAPTGPVSARPGLLLPPCPQLTRAATNSARALSPGPPACLFAECPRPLAPWPCAAVGSGAASTSPPCGTRRKELVLVGLWFCTEPECQWTAGQSVLLGRVAEDGIQQ